MNQTLSLGVGKEVFEPVHQKIRQRRFQEALTMLYDQKANRLKPAFRNFPNHAWYVVGDIKYKIRDFNKAIEAFKKAIRQLPSDGDAYLALANSYSELKQVNLSIKALKKCIAFGASDGRHRYNLGNCYFDIGDFEEASRYFKSVTRVQKNGIGALARRNLKICKEKMSQV
jgi:tetratricopeptide (TPR) repeat protein